MKKILTILFFLTTIPAIGQTFIEKQTFRGDTIQSWHRAYLILKGSLLPWLPNTYDLGNDTLPFRMAAARKVRTDSLYLPALTASRVPYLDANKIMTTISMDALADSVNSDTSYPSGAILFGGSDGNITTDSNKLRYDSARRVLSAVNVVADSVISNFIMSSPVQVTYDQADSLRENGLLSTNITYEITDATASQQGGRGSIYINAINDSFFRRDAMWKLPTDLRGFGWLAFPTFGVGDSIFSVMVNGIDQLNDTITFNTDLNTTIRLLASAINANSLNTVKAFVHAPGAINAASQRPRLILQWDYAEDSVNGYAIAISSTAGVTTASPKVFSNGHDVDTLYYYCFYDFPDDDVVYIYGIQQNFILSTDNNNTMYGFRHGDPDWSYGNSIVYGLSMTAMFDPGFNIAQYVSSPGDSEFNMDSSSWYNFNASQTRHNNGNIDFQGCYSESSSFGVNGGEISSDGSIKVRNTIFNYTGATSWIQSVLFRTAIDVDSSRFDRVVQLASAAGLSGSFIANTREGSIEIKRTWVRSTATNNLRVIDCSFNNKSKIKIYDCDFSTGVPDFVSCNLFNQTEIIFDSTTLPGLLRFTDCNFRNNAKGLNFTNLAFPSSFNVTGLTVNDRKWSMYFTMANASLNGSSGRGSVGTIVNLNGGFIPKNFVMDNFTWEATLLASSGAATLRLGYGSMDSAGFRRMTIASLNGIQFQKQPIFSLKNTSISPLKVIAGTSSVNAGSFTVFVEGHISAYDDTLPGTAFLANGTVSSVSSGYGLTGNVTTTGTIAVDSAVISLKYVRKADSTGSTGYATQDDIRGFALASTNTSGTYTPTLTNTTNITSSTPGVCIWSRNDSMVTVVGSFTVTTTLAVATELGISLPVASNFTVTDDLNGVGQPESAIATNIYARADATNDRMAVNFTALSIGGNGIIHFTLMYKIK